MQRAIALGFAVVGLGLTLPAAADPSRIFGKWVEQGPNGTEMIAEFTPTTISSYGINQAGQRVGEGRRFPATYRDLNSSTIEVDVRTGDKVILHIRDADTIDMEFPGVGTHTMTRDNP
jgi:hypothetical protein